MIGIQGEVLQVGTGHVDLECLGPSTALERRHIVDAGAKVGVVGLEDVSGLLLDRELAVVSLREVGHLNIDRSARHVALALDRATAVNLADRREQVLGPLEAAKPPFDLAEEPGDPHESQGPLVFVRVRHGRLNRGLEDRKEIGGRRVGELGVDAANVALGVEEGV